MSEGISIKCPRCSGKVALPWEWKDKTGQCPECEIWMNIPPEVLSKLKAERRRRKDEEKEAKRRELKQKQEARRQEREEARTAEEEAKAKERKQTLDSVPADLATPPPSVPLPVPQAPEQRPPAQVAAAAVTNVHVHGTPQGKSVSGLGVAALVLGILAALTCWIPFIGILGTPLSLVGCVLGLLGLILALAVRKTGVGMPSAGLVTSGVALAIAVLTTGVAATAISEAAREIERSQLESLATNQEALGGAPELKDSGGVKAKTDTPTPPPAGTGSAKEPPAATPQWASARQAVRQGHMQIKIKKCAFGKVAVASVMDESESKGSLLAITLDITNLSETKKVTYRTWRGGDFVIKRDYATLTDSFGNSYQRITFGFSTKPKGAVASESVYPAKTIQDVLVFEAPIEKAEHLRLELPAENVGGKGMFRLQIPKDMIERID